MLQKIKENYLYIISIGLTLVFVLFNISTAPLVEWDESRNGINAIEMVRNGNYFVLHYAHTPDHWNAKRVSGEAGLAGEISLGEATFQANKTEIDHR